MCVCVRVCVLVEIISKVGIQYTWGLFVMLLLMLNKIQLACIKMQDAPYDTMQ